MYNDDSSSSDDENFDLKSIIEKYDNDEREKRKISKGKEIESKSLNPYNLVKPGMSIDKEKVSEPFFHKIEHLFKESTSVAKQNLDDVCKDRFCFILTNILTKEECKILIETAEDIGFQDAEEYCHQYRDRYNDRLMVDDEAFSDFIWKRVSNQLPQKIRGKWNILCLNQRWRLCRYHKGHYFGMHVDGTYRPSSNVCSGLTFMLYLNSPIDGDYQGGSTNFLQRNGVKIKKEIIPEAGMALVFEQEDMELLHEGAELKQGTKYILRTDVMYTTKGEYN